MRPTALIASGAYVDPELEAEFGRLPPSFLPLQNRRLYEHQLDFLRPHASRILLSLPADFCPDPFDTARLGAVELRAVPLGLALHLSLLHVLEAAKIEGPLILLHGDTLLENLDFSRLDSVSIHASVPPFYRWGHVTQARGLVTIHDDQDVPGNAILTGAFLFRDATAFIAALRGSRNFLSALAAYALPRGLRAQDRSGNWMDFGHASTYHRSRRRMTAARRFNRLRESGRALVKTGEAEKIAAEAAWYEALPPPLRLHMPAFLGRVPGQAAYALEYLHLPTLADLFVFGRLSAPAWRDIFAACAEFLAACARYPAPGPAPHPLYLEKTLRRLEAFSAATGLGLDVPCRCNGTPLPSLRGMAQIAAAAIPPAPPASLIHGDFCFSNIFYDARAGLIRAIDPRGLDGANHPTPYGDIRYDIAKLFHSARGLYDHIIAGNFLLRGSALDLELELPDSPSLRAVADLFLATDFAGFRPDAAASPAIAILLFFAMLPLHDDDATRQRALLANGMRLFRDFLA